MSLLKLTLTNMLHVVPADELILKHDLQHTLMCIDNGEPLNRKWNTLANILNTYIPPCQGKETFITRTYYRSREWLMIMIEFLK